MPSSSDDANLIEKAEEEAANERLINAGRLLKEVKDESLLERKHVDMIRRAKVVEKSMNELIKSPDDKENGWKKQKEKHGDRDFFVYYKVTEKNQLYCRIDCAIEASLLVPLLSVFNETSLYKTCLPYYKRPVKFGIRESKMLKQSGRAHQIVMLTVDMWPLSPREIVMDAVAVDIIDEKAAIAIVAQSVTPEDDPIIPKALPSYVRIDLEEGILIRACPANHPCLTKSKIKYPKNEDLILISMSLTTDGHIKYIPKKMINFITRTVIGRMWSSTLKVAEDIRDGKRNTHQDVINEKEDLYGWIKERIDTMLRRMNDDK